MQRQINPRLLKSEPMQRCRLGECRAACCLYGVWIDRDEARRILENAAQIAPHMTEGQQDPSSWFDDREEPDEFTPSGWTVHSRVLDAPHHYGGTACVFLRDDFKCALQVAGDVNGLHPWHYKPFYCVLHPLDLDDQGHITLDQTPLMLDEPGSCLRPADHLIPLLETFEPELRYLLGDLPYQELLDQRDRFPGLAQ